MEPARTGVAQISDAVEQQAKTFTQSQDFITGEEVTLKGLPFVVIDIQAGQMKLKSKPPSNARPPDLQRLTMIS
jgi:hypothetical protein